MTAALTDATLDTLQALERAPSALKVKEVFRRFAEPYGYNSFLCTDPPRNEENADGSILFGEWPQAWRRRYMQRKYYYLDPMVLELHRTMHPYTWTEALQRRDYSKDERRIVSEASEWGMLDGFVVPIHVSGGRVHAVTMAGTSPRADLEARAPLHLVAIYAHARASTLKRQTPDEPLMLTRRERQVLQWAAAGKTDWEIGQILGVSPSAVHKHVENVKRRLGVGTRIQAIVVAIRQGEIGV
jgi:LuxR family quorum sensing-dependent transcriptional regulator